MEKVVIESMSYGPAAVARCGGEVLFVDGGAPGDVALVRRRGERKRHAEAELVELIHPSPARVDPPCPHYAECGGCQWMHLSHAAQLAWKRNSFLQAVRRIGRTEPEECHLALGTPALHYRYRAKMSARMHSGSNRLGFNAWRTHRFVPVERCLQMAPPLAEAKARVEEALATFPGPPGFHQIELSASPLSGRWFALIHASERSRCRVEALLSALEGASGLVWAGWAPQRTEKRLYYKAAGIPLGFGPYSFIQGNPLVNERLVAEVLSMAGEAPGRVLDLYCGIGNFALPLAQRAVEVVGIECNPMAVADAEANAKAAGLPNVRFEKGDAARVASRLLEAGERFDAVVLDPPRIGCREVIEPVCRMRPRRIVYVSCEPPTFARDAALLEQAGYRLRRSLVLDMFPQTFRIESANLFTPEG